MFLITIFLAQAAAITKNVPASIRSGIISWKQPINLSTPSIVMTFVPAPRICAPILFNNVATSMISGSFAAFSIVVRPFAYTAAIIILMVAPTLAISKKIFAPFNSLASIV